jgi:nucleoid DNA-binding protein
MIIGFRELYLQHKDNLSVNKDFSTYNNIWETLNRAIVDAAVRGEIIKIPQQFGEFRVVRRRRYIAVKENGKLSVPINWAKTKKLRKEGTLKEGKFIYFTDPFYCGFHLSFKKHQIIGKQAFKFKSSRTNGYNSKSGAVNKLWTYLTENDSNYLRFPLL